MRRRERVIAAALFAAAGAGAAALHVVVETPAAVRDWRQTLPLAAVLGGAIGWLLAPTSAMRGATAAVGGLVVFGAVFALAHAAISGGGTASALGRTLAAIIGFSGGVAIAFGALAGWAAGRIGPSSR